MFSRFKYSVSIRVSRQKARWCFGAFALVGILLHVAPEAICGQDSPQATDRDVIQQLLQSNRQLVQQVQDLQARLQQLETKVNEAAPAPAAGVAVSATGQTTAPLPKPVVVPTVAPPDQEAQGASSAPGLKLRLFGDVGYEASDKKGVTNSFHIGSLDLFMTGNLSDKVSILGEVLFVSQADNGITPDVERLLLQYKHNDYFNFAIGRYHTSIGYYNTAFHQGAWFQTATDRPFMYAFDDRGGFLPLQEVGVTLNGQIPSGKLGLNYVAEMGNGRSHLLRFDPAQNRQDTNNGKSFNLALCARPSWVPGLQTGFSIYHDYLTFSDNINHDELISTIHVVYANSIYEFLNEGMLVRHTKNMINQPGVFHTPGFYSQISRKFGKYRPYFRYAYLNAGVAEPIYGDPTDGPVVGRRNGSTFGIRYDFNDHAAAKLQYDRLGLRGQPSSNSLETQFSFAF